MNDPKWLRAPTIFEAFQKAGAKIAVVTAKDKLRLLLGKGLVFDGTAVCFSSENADKATLEGQRHRQMSATWSAWPCRMSIRRSFRSLSLRRASSCWHRMKPDLMYLSTTDYVQHKYAPGSTGANSFYAMMDGYLGELDAQGAIVVIVADHGMKDKHLANGEPDVIYLQDVLDTKFGAGKTKVILPITDPYVRHHGALGSFATVYVYGPSVADVIGGSLPRSPASMWCLTGREGCARFELPEDRMGDIIVVSGGPHGIESHRHQPRASMISRA